MEQTHKSIIKSVVLLVSVVFGIIYLKIVAKNRAEAAERSRLEQLAKPDPNVLMSGSKSMVTTKFIEIEPKKEEPPSVSPENLATSSKSGPTITAEELERIMQEAKKEASEQAKPKPQLQGADH